MRPHGWARRPQALAAAQRRCSTTGSAAASTSYCACKRKKQRVLGSTSNCTACATPTAFRQCKAPSKCNTCRVYADGRLIYFSEHSKCAAPQPTNQPGRAIGKRVSQTDVGPRSSPQQRINLCNC
eukprot:5090525-Pleurochrysis_carterae.AAC.2